MRHVSSFKNSGNSNDGGQESGTPPRAATATKSNGVGMQRPAEFYQQVAERRFSDAKTPVDAAELERVIKSGPFREMMAHVRDSEVRAAASTPTATVAPERVYRAWAGLLIEELEQRGTKPADIERAFTDAVEWGKEILLSLRGDNRSFVFRNQLQTNVDVIAKVGPYEPEVLLARAMSQKPELGGSTILSSALDRCYVPNDVSRALQAQVRTIPLVASNVPAVRPTVPATRLDDVGVVDALMLFDTTYQHDIAALRAASGNRRAMSADNLNLRDQVANPRVLAETFGRLAPTMGTVTITPAERELYAMVARLATSNEVTSVVKRAAFLGLDTALARFAQDAKARGQNVTIPVYESLASALFDMRRKLDAEITGFKARNIDATQSEALRDSVADLIGSVFRENGEAQFALDSMASSNDPGSILLRTMLHKQTRASLIDGVLNRKASGNARATQIALATDKTVRENELRKLIATDANFRPGAESAALLLSWPDDLPRPSFESQAAPARVAAFATLSPNNNLAALVAAGAKDTEIFTELFRIARAQQFLTGDADANLDETMRKIVSGELDVKYSPLRFQLSDHTAAVRASQAISLLPKQLEHCAFTQEQVKENIARAIRTRNAQLLISLPALLKAPKHKVELKTVLDALRYVDPKQPPGQGDTIISGVNVLFAYSVLAICVETLGSIADNAVKLAAQDLLKRTGLVPLAPYAGMSPEDNLVILKHESKPKPGTPIGLGGDNPFFIPLLDTLELPPNALALIAARTDLHEFAPETLFELLARAIDDKKVDSDAVVRLTVAAVTCRPTESHDLRSTNVWATFHALADRGYGPDIGKKILAAIATMDNVDAIYRAAATCAIDGKLFSADDVAEVVMARDPTKGAAVMNELGVRSSEFFDALSDTYKAKLVGRVLQGLESATDASVLDTTRPCFARLSDLTARGVKLDIDLTSALKAVVTNASMRAGRNPLEVSALGPILTDARASGVDVDAIVNDILSDKPRAKAVATLTPSQLAAVRFELARLVPTCDESLIKAPAIALAPGPFVAAFDLIAERPLPPAIATNVCRAAIQWAANQRAFATVVSFRTRLLDQGLTDRAAVFDAALADEMRTQPQIWQSVPEARALAAINKLEELRSDILELAKGGDDAAGRAQALADRIASIGPYAPELVPQVLAALRHATRTLRPSLDDVQVGLDVPETPNNSSNTKNATRTIDFFGLPLRAYEGDRNHVDVPRAPDFVPTPVAMSNAKKIRDALESAHPFVIILGPPGLGKTFGVKALAHYMGAPLLELDGGPGRRVDEFNGSWSQDKQGMPEYQRAAYRAIMEKGGIVVDDEFNASNMSVMLAEAEQAARFNKPYTFRTDVSETKVRSPHAKQVLIGNFLDRVIPESLREHAHVVYLDALPLEDLKMIAQARAPNLPPDDLEKIGLMQTAVEDIVLFNRLSENSISLSVRNLIRAARRAEAYRSAPALAAARAARECYLDGVTDPTARGLIEAEFERVFEMKAEATKRNPADIEIRQNGNVTIIGEATVRHGLDPVVDAGNVTTNIFNRTLPYIIGDRERIELEELGKALEMNENTLYTSPSGSGVMGTVETIAAVNGLRLIVKDTTTETWSSELFGEESSRQADTGAFETYFANGFITDISEQGGIVVLRNVHHLKDETRIQLHRMLEERRVPGPKGTFIDMHPDAHVIMTTEPSQVLGAALLNRVTQRALTRLSQAEKLERLVQMGERVGVPKVIVEQMVRFDGMWTNMLGRSIAEWVQPHNLPVPGMTKLGVWLGDFAKVFAGTSKVPGTLDEQVRSVFIQGGATHYAVPSSRKADANRRVMMTDTQRVEAILTALFEGNDREAQDLSS